MKYFTINELCKSHTAKRNKIDNTPTKEAEQNLINLVNNILDPLREAWDAPIIIGAGYRCPELNKLSICGNTNPNRRSNPFKPNFKNRVNVIIPPHKPTQNTKK